MIHKGSLVKMKLGHSGPGVILDTMPEHPRANDSAFAPIRGNLKEPHARVFWHDLQCAEIIRISCVEVMQ